MFPARTVARVPFEAMPVPSALAEPRAALSVLAHMQGLTPFLSTDWAELEDLNARHRSSWFELLPRPASTPCLWVGLENSAGDVVAAQAAILLDCTGKSYGARLEAMTAFYDDPGAAEASGAWCFSASPEAREACGKVAMMSSGWVHPDWRGGHRDLFHLSGRLNRLAVLARWAPDWLVALVDPNVSRLWTEKAVGQRHMDRHATILFHQPGEGRLRLHLMRLRPDDVTADLQRRAFSPQTAPLADCRPGTL
ncbi:hypothetical protein [Azospirillum brasilense]|nr:hypothetical protein [Azospirillum brasilense]